MDRYPETSISRTSTSKRCQLLALLWRAFVRIFNLDKQPYAIGSHRYNIGDDFPSETSS